MKVHGRPTRTIRQAEDGWAVEIIDQTQLPHHFVIRRLTTLDEAAHAISAMLVRGAPLIGATAAYGVCLALREDASDHALDNACDTLMATRPTAVNLRWALKKCGFFSPLFLRISGVQRHMCRQQKSVMRTWQSVTILASTAYLLLSR